MVEFWLNSCKLDYWPCTQSE